MFLTGFGQEGGAGAGEEELGDRGHSEQQFQCNKHFESSQNLRKDGIGMLENFIENTLSNYILTLYLFTVLLCFV